MNDDTPETVKETVLWVKGIVRDINTNIAHIKSEILELKKQSGIIGKWIIRIIGGILAIGQIIIVYKLLLLKEIVK